MLVYIVVSFLASSVASKHCYFNAECPYTLFSTRTPYDVARGDIRDIPNPESCQPVSVWALMRHGNRNPSDPITQSILGVIGLKDDIVAAYDDGRSNLCAQDVEGFRSWTWNTTIETAPAFLTGTGYEELYDLGKRFRLRYPHLLKASEDQFYFRPTNEQRTITSAVAFILGLTEGTALNLTHDGPWEVDNVIRPYKSCDRHQKLISSGEKVMSELEEWAKLAEVIAVRDAVQKRIGITRQLTVMDVYSIYELCGYTKSWKENKQSPWCSLFSNEDLIVMEYRDDLRHYYSSGYGSKVNIMLGELIMKDLLENFDEFVKGNGKNIVAYFTHDSAMEMAYSAVGLFRDSFPLTGAKREPKRVWRTSLMSSFTSNIIAVLNKCQELGTQSYRVQIFGNEKESELCPLNGCYWEEFEEIFKNFTTNNLDFCSLDYKMPEAHNSGVLSSAVLLSLIAFLQVYFLFLL